MQIAVELAAVASVSIAAREPLRWQAQRILGRDFHWWLTRTGLDTSWLGPRLARGSVPVIDDGGYRAAIRTGRPDHRPAAAQRVPRIALRAADLLLAGLVVFFVVTGVGQLAELGWAAIGVIAIVVAASLALVVLPWLGAPGERRAVGMTAAVRNLSLALFFASAMPATVVLTLLAYGLLMYGLSVPVALWLARNSAG